MTFCVALWGVWVYHRNAQLERAKWLERLYERFYCNDSLKEVRDLIDSDDKASVARLDQMVADEDFKFTDYLNFFEFVAILESRGQLLENEVDDLFCYYLRNLKKHKSISAYIGDPKKGFEKLHALIGKMRSL